LPATPHPDYRWNLSQYATQLDEALRVVGEQQFRQLLLRITGAHACVVKISHGPNEPALRRDVTSFASEAETETYLSMVDRNRATIVAKEDRPLFPPPSRIWKQLRHDAPEEFARFRCLIIGIAPSPPRNLSEYAMMTVWPENRKSKAVKLSSEASHYTFLRRQYKASTASRLVKANREITCYGKGISPQTIARLRRIANYTQLTQHPVSILSIPVPLKTSGSTEASHYLSAEVYWFGTPAVLSSEQISAAVVATTLSANRLTFEVQTHELITNLITFAKRVKHSDSIVHTATQWTARWQDALKWEPSLWSRVGHLDGQYYANRKFHQGLEVIARRSGDGTTFALDINSLFVCVALHFNVRNIPDFTIHIEEGDVAEACTSAAGLCNYSRWFEFLDIFFSGASGYNDGVVISNARLKHNQLELGFDQPRNMDELRKRFAAAVDSTESPAEGQATKALYESLCRADGKVGKCEFRDRTLRVKLWPRTSQESPLVWIEITDFAISIGVLPSEETRVVPFEFEKNYSVLIVDSLAPRAEALKEWLNSCGYSVTINDGAARPESLHRAVFLHATDAAVLDPDNLPAAWLDRQPIIFVFSGSLLQAASAARLCKERLPAFLHGRVVMLEEGVSESGLVPLQQRRVQEILRVHHQDGKVIDGRVPALPSFIYVPAVALFAQRFLLFSRKDSVCLDELLHACPLLSKRGQGEASSTHAAGPKRVRELIDRFTDEYSQLMGHTQPSELLRIYRSLITGKSISRANIASSYRQFAQERDAAYGKDLTPRSTMSGDRTVGLCLYHYECEALLGPVLQWCLERHGWNLKMTDITSSYDLPNDSTPIICLWTKKCGPVEEVNLLDRLKDYADIDLKSLVIVNTLPHTTPFLEYMATCGAIVLSAYTDLAKLYELPESKFALKLVEPSHPLITSLMLNARHDSQLIRYVKRLQHLCPALGDIS